MKFICELATVREVAQNCCKSLDWVIGVFGTLSVFENLKESLLMEVQTRMGCGEMKEVVKGQIVPCQKGFAKDSLVICSINITEQLSDARKLPIYQVLLSLL